MNWQVGDRAIFVSVKGDACNSELYGEVCELLSFEGKPMFGTAESVWRVKFAAKTTFVATICLKPIPDTYDGLEVTTWSECPFKPRELVTCKTHTTT